MIAPDHTLNTLGLYCPIPVILTSKKMKKMQQDEILEVLSDDEGVKKDMEVWCKNSGNEWLAMTQDGETITLYVRKRDGSEADGSPGS